MSPLSTLKSCGSSSIEVLRRIAPTRVRRSSPSMPPGRCRRAASAPLVARHPQLSRIERNLSISNVRPSRPTRSWRKSERPAERDPGCRAPPTSIKGRRTISISSASTRSSAYLIANCQPLRVRRMRGEQRQAAEVIDRQPVGHLLEQARYQRDADSELLAALDHAQQHVVGRGREGDDHLADTVLAHDLLEIPARSEHGQVRAREPCPRAAPCPGSRSAAGQARDARAASWQSCARPCRHRRPALERLRRSGARAPGERSSPIRPQ